MGISTDTFEVNNLQCPPSLLLCSIVSSGRLLAKTYLLLPNSLTMQPNSLAGAGSSTQHHMYFSSDPYWTPFKRRVST